MPGARSVARPRARAADDLSAQGSGLCARQAQGSSHAPGIPTPTPAVNLRFNIDGLTEGRERVGGFLVGEEKMMMMMMMMFITIIARD